MSQLAGEKKPSGTKLVFVIQYHDFLEVVLAPYMVNEMDSGEFSMSFKRLNSETITDYFRNCTKEQKQLVDILNRCRDEELMRRFLKKTTTPAAFFDELPEQRLKLLVKPFVQKQFDMCLRILQQTGIPLYYKGRKNDPVGSRPFPVQKGEARAIFNFTKHEKESHYHLTLEDGDSVISLNDPPSLVIVNNPAWILTAGKVFLVEPGIEGLKLRPFFSKDYIVVPAAAELKYFRSFMANAITNHKVRASGIEIKVENTICKPSLHLESDLQGNPVLTLNFIYGKKQSRFNDTNNCWVELIVEDGIYSFRKIIRDRNKENYFIDQLLEKNLRTDDMHFFYSGHREKPGDNMSNPVIYKMVNWLGINSVWLKKEGYDVRQDFFRDNFYTGPVRLEFGISESNDWFDIHAYAVFGQFRIPFVDLKNHLLGGKRELTLPDGKIAILPEEWFARYSDILVYCKTGEGTLKFHRHHFTIAARFGTEKEKAGGIFRLNDKDRLSLPDIPPEISGILRPYQRAGFSWMYFLYRHNLGGCLADDMGLGKTIQTLTLLWKLKKECPVTRSPAISKNPLQLDLFSENSEKANHAMRTSLIVMPLSLIHNWENEIRKFTPGLDFMRYSGTGRNSSCENFVNYDIVLTTYGVVRNDLEFLKNYEFFYLILDESQIIKNPDSKISRSVRQLRARHRLILTGTPIENSLIDLWSQMSFLNQGLLGGKRFFINEFVHPVEKLQNQDKKRLLKKMIEPFILRRTKNNVEKDLPDLNEKLHYCEMSNFQQKLYESVKSEIRNRIMDKLGSGNRKDLNVDILRGLTRLRLIANHPGLAGQSGEESGKFGEVLRNIENLMAEGHKVLIFSQFVRHLNLYRDYFDSQSWKHSYLTGEIKESLRKGVVSEFQDNSDNLLFLISLKAGGVGLNLTSADYVFLLDPWWNPAVEQQAVSRAHRIGQRKTVFSYKYISTGTVEEKIVDLQQRKSDLAGNFISTGNPLKLFTEEEIIGLFD